MNEIKYNFYHWGPFLFHSTMEPELCKLMLDEGLKVRGKSDKLHIDKLAGHLSEEYKLDAGTLGPKLAVYLEAYSIGYNQWRGGGGMQPKATLLGIWINYMKAGDFNPPHSHGADLSFVAFPDVPKELAEECAAFNKKVLVCRNTTERPEGVDAGFAKLVHIDIINHFHWANESPQWSGENPYGNGDASTKIVDSIINE